MKLASFVTISFLSAAAAAQELPQPSPKAKIEQRVGVTDVSLDYSSPAVKGRKIWGDLVPYDKLWRTGANAPTKLTVSRDFSFGDKKVKAGSYALCSIPGKTTWTVLLNTNLAGGCLNGYDQKNDVARITVKPTKLGEKRERLTFLFSDTTDGATALDLEWDTTRVRIPLKMDTAAHVAASIEQATSEAWRPHWASARYLLDSGGDVDRALGYINSSIAIRATWWNHWVKAQILAKKGNKAEATAAATEAQRLGKGDQVYEGFFKDQIATAIEGWKK